MENTPPTYGSTSQNRKDFLERKCIGTLLGACCGDMLGAGVEFKTAHFIRLHYGEVKDFLRKRYTDDTEMLTALTVSLLSKNGVDPEDCAKTYAKFYDLGNRGYGPSVSEILVALHQNKVSYKQAGSMIYPSGSYANGGVMRIAPVGLAYRNASEEVLENAVRGALLCTHIHPEAIDGAYLQALAVSRLSKIEDVKNFDAVQFVKTLLKEAKDEIVIECIQTALEMFEKKAFDTEAMEKINSPNMFGRVFQIRASEALASALFAFLHLWNKPEECIIKAVGFGGDADTVGCIVGALVGALHGNEWIPQRWFDNIESGEHGRDWIIDLAKKLCDLDVRSYDASLNAIEPFQRKELEQKK